MKRNMTLVLAAMLAAFLFSACQQATEQAEQEPASTDLPDVQYVGYKIIHHMTAQTKHIQEFGFNVFDHPRISDHTSFVITPALDHFYSKAVADLRFGPVVIETPPKDDRYSSLELFDMEHHTLSKKA